MQAVGLADMPSPHMLSCHEQVLPVCVHACQRSPASFPSRSKSMVPALSYVVHPHLANSAKLVLAASPKREWRHGASCTTLVGLSCDRYRRLTLWLPHGLAKDASLTSLKNAIQLCCLVDPFGSLESSSNCASQPYDLSRPYPAVLSMRLPALNPRQRCVVRVKADAKVRALTRQPTYIHACVEQGFCHSSWHGWGLPCSKLFARKRTAQMVLKIVCKEENCPDGALLVTCSCQCAGLDWITTAMPVT